MHQRRWQWTIAVGILVLTLCFGGMFSARGQLTAPSSSGSGAQFIPAGVSRYGNIEVTAVKSRLTGQMLFAIASETVFDRSKGGDKIPVEVRAAQIRAAMDRAVAYFSKTKEKLVVVVQPRGDSSYLLQAEGRRSAQAGLGQRQIQLVTVTALDAYYYGQSPLSVAQQWQQTLQRELQEEVRLTTPEALLEGLGRAGQLLLLCSGMSLLLWALQRWIQPRWAALKTLQKVQAKEAKQELATPQAAVSPEEGMAQLRSQFLATLPRILSVKSKLWLYALLRWLLFWFQVVLWYVGAYLIIAQIPPLMRYRGLLGGIPIQLLLIWFATGLAVRLSSRIIDQLNKNWNSSPFLSQALGDSQRRLLRSTTISTAAEGLATFLLWTTGLISALNVVGIPTGSVLAGGAILGLAISFGSQSLVKDLVNGCLILLEDQFAVGDVIRLNAFQGLVETLNLRVTQLRSAEGKLITIPNSAIVAVENLTRSWSRVDFTLEVAYEADLDRTLQVLEQVAVELYEDPAWRPKILEAPQILGVEHLSHTGMQLRVWIKTLPLEQWRVGCEYRYRVRQALESQGVPIQGV